MPKSRGPRRERPHDWHLIQQDSLWPEQKAYELLRPVVLFHEPAAERAQETGTAERTVQYHAEQFDQQGMVSLFAKSSAPTPAPSRRLPPDRRQLIVDLHAEYPNFHLRAIAAICYVRFGRKPSHHRVKLVLAAGPAPSRTGRRFLPYSQIADPFQRRLAVVRLHAEGWSVTTISRSLHPTRNRVYAILPRWVREDLAGLHAQSHAPKAPPRKVTFEAITQVRKLAGDTPELGALRVRAALEHLGIALSQATCGRLLALNRQLYGLERPKRSAAPKREMPFKARFRHDWWRTDVRYIEHHQLRDHPGPIYQITILENYSRCGQPEQTLLHAESVGLSGGPLRGALNRWGPGSASSAMEVPSSRAPRRKESIAC